MRIRAVSLAIAASFSINALAQTEQFDLLQQQASQQVKKRSSSHATEQKLKRSPRIDNSKNVYMTPVLGTPQFFWANPEIKTFEIKSGQKISADSLNEKAGRYYIEQYQKELGLTERARRGLTFDFASQVDKNKPIMVRYKQEVRGIPVLGSAVNLLMDKNHKLVSVGATLAPKVKRFANEQDFKLQETKAVAIALSDLINVPVPSKDLLLDAAKKKVSLNEAQSGWQLSSDISVSKVFYPQKDRILSAYKISIRANHAGNNTRASAPEVRHFGYVVSATDGKILQKKNYSHSIFHSNSTDFGYLVFADRSTKLPQDGPDGNQGSPHPTGQPDGFQAPLSTPNMLTMRHAGIHTQDPWLPSGATETKGNNVDAYIDASAPDGFTPDSDDMRAKANANNEFDYVFDGSKDANADDVQKQAAITNLFYTINYLHDVFYNAGFDEISGNAQLNNYGRGGIEGDPILAEGQDFSGINNANMATPSDGESPIMQQYLFQGAPILSFDFAGGKDYKFKHYQNGLGEGVFDSLATVDFIAPDNDTQNICQTHSNGADFDGKILVINHTDECDASVLYDALKAISPVAVMIVNTGAIPRYFDEPLPYGVIDIDGAESAFEFVKDVAAGGISGHVSQKEQMFRDSTMSNLVIMHEWGHYLHGRLAGNGEGPARTTFGGGMGEGFGDFIALMHQVREEDLGKPGGDNYNGVYAQGGWTDGSFEGSDNQAYYFGIRRVPYSTDMSKNGFTYRHFRLGEILPTNHPISGGETTVKETDPHTQGEVWGTMLFEAFMGLARDTDRLTLDQAKARMRQYLVSGLKLTPWDATYLVARDAIIASALANDIEDAKIIVKAFAKRGMGTAATSPDPWSFDLTEGLTESFDTSPSARAGTMNIGNISNSCDTDDIWDPTEVAELDLSIVNAGIDTLAAGQMLISSDSKIKLLDGSTIGHGELAPYASEQLKLKVRLDQDAPYYQDVTLSVASSLTPDNKTEFSFKTNYDFGLSAIEKFEDTADNSKEKRFDNWTNTRELDNGDLEWDTWRVRYNARTDSVVAFLFPFVGNKDESLESTEITVASDADFEMSFEHVYIYREGLSGGVIEIREVGGEWTTVGGDKITRFDLDGNEEGKGYGATIDANAGTSFDGLEAFSGVNVTQYEIDNHWNYELRKAHINFGRDYAGKKVQLRFRLFASENPEQLTDYWELDNVELKGANKVFDNTLIENVKLCTDNVAPQLSLSAAGGAFTNNVLAVTANAGSIVTLKASATDANNDQLSYKWEQVSGINISLNNSTSANLTLNIPKKAKSGELKFKVTVSNGKESVTSNAVVTVKERKSNGGSFGMALLLGLLGVRFMRKKVRL